MPAINNLFIC